MTSKGLRTSLIKSAVLLVVLSMLVYLTAVSPDGSLWASLGTLFMAVFRAIQLSIGLIISLLFCLVVLVGIFLGGVAMVSRESAANMVEFLRQEIKDKYQLITGPIKGILPHGNTGITRSIDGEELREGILNRLENMEHGLRRGESAVKENIAILNQRVDEIEKGETRGTVYHQLDQHGKAIHKITEFIDSAQNRITLLEVKVGELTKYMQNDNSGTVLEDLLTKTTELQETTVSLRAELIDIRNALQEGEKDDRKAASFSAEQVEHRLFAYLKNKVQQEKVEQLVTETLASNMSYAQVTDYLIKQTKGKTAEILKAHPKLVKNYIRYRRENG